MLNLHSGNCGGKSSDVEVERDVVDRFTTSRTLSVSYLNTKVIVEKVYSLFFITPP